MASGNHFPEEHIIHVPQREQPQAQKEESPSLSSVCEVVVPQHHHRKGCQDNKCQQEVQSCYVEEDWQQEEWWEQADIDLYGPLKPGDAEAIQDGVCNSL